MIPYFEVHSFNIGPITIQVWGLLVAIGFLVATWLASRFVKQQGVKEKFIWDLSVIAMVTAFIGARLGHVFFYEWSYFSEHLIEIPMVWQGGLSSYGGFVAAGIACLAYLSFKKQDLHRISDATLAALPLGWAIGRVGCFLIHDHPGTLTNSPFGIQFPEGARFDLGMIDGIIGLIVFLTAYPIYKKTRNTMPGFTSGYVLSSYAIMRFFADFLRATDLPHSDPRIAGLTPAQYASVLFLALGIFLIVRALKKKKNDITK